MTQRRAAVATVATAWLFLLLASAGAAAPLQTGADSPREILDRAVRLLREGNALEALMQVERALSRDPELWEAHLVQGEALQALGDDLGGRDAFLAAARAAPGTPEAHFLAAASSLRVADFDVAWEQAILAAQAGRREQMDELLAALRRVSDPPDDLGARLAAPRLRVEAGSGVDPGAVRAVRQALVDAPGLALVRGESEHRVELAPEDGDLLVRLLGPDGAVLLERRIGVPDAAIRPDLLETVAEIESRMRADEGRRP